ncbi:MAG: hypothetical protein LHW41_05470 [Candidatus Cloacimonetes bacterium]|jgi:hypothetical protein|nr:hypothetical protein [Candidatus Cloacimonadota bacterium]
MKSYLHLAILAGLTLLLNSCITDPLPQPLETWLCSINADGTNFTLIQKDPFITSGIKEMYSMVDGKLLIYSDAMWLHDPQDLSLVRITPDTLINDQLSRVSQLSDGSKMYFSANRNLYELTYPTLHLRQLTSNISASRYKNPVISKSGNILCFSSYTQINQQKDYTNYGAYLNMETQEIVTLPSLGRYLANLVYNESDKKLYFTLPGQLNKSNLDGSDLAFVGTGCAETHRFYLSDDQIHLICDPGLLKVINLLYSSEECIESGTVVGGYGLFSSSQSGDVIYYPSKQHDEIWKYLVSNHVSEFVAGIPSSVSIDQVRNLASAWDGSMVYFYCDLARR